MYASKCIKMALSILEEKLLYNSKCPPVRPLKMLRGGNIMFSADFICKVSSNPQHLLYIFSVYMSIVPYSFATYGRTSLLVTNGLQSILEEINLCLMNNLILFLGHLVLLFCSW